jgi:hypothetical protein
LKRHIELSSSTPISPLFKEILSKEVTVKAAGYRVKGIFVGIQQRQSYPFPHLPEVLFLEREEGITVIRNWELIIL